MSDDIFDGAVTKTKPNAELIVRETKQRFLQVADESVFTREAQFAVQALMNNDALLKCSRESIQQAVCNIALTGATLNPIMAQAYLIPRKGKCCLDFSYRGLIKLAVDSGSVLDMDATVVHSKDEFSYEMGLTPKLKHVPSMDDDPGEMTFVYAIAILLSGIKKFIVLNRAEVEKIRKTSQMKDSGMWKDFYDEACRKTAIKKLYKMLPQTDKLSNAVMVVNQTDGFEFERLKDDTNAKKLFEQFNPIEPEITEVENVRREE
jgi:recombination protein RecT